MKRRVLALIQILVLGACGTDDRPFTGTVRDSAGIRIVVSRPAQEVPRWTVAPHPRAVIGAAQGERQVLFDHIRGLDRLAKGGIVVADGGSNEIRVFSPDGELQHVFGGSGGGPGEFQLLREIVVLRGDTIIARDGRDGTIAAFTATGDLAWEQQLPVPVAAMALIGAEFDGALLFANISALAPGAPEGIHRPLTHYVAYHRTTATLDTIAALPGYEFYAEQRGESWGAYEIPFARDAIHAVGAEHIYLANNDRFEIQVRDFDGVLTSLWRYPDGERALGPDEVDRLEKAVLRELEPSPPRQDAINNLFHGIPRPPIRPAFSRLVVDYEERLWVGEWRSGFAPYSQDSRRWWIFNSAGQLAAKIELPASLEVVGVGEDSLLAIQIDELGIERIVILEVQETSS